MMVEVSCAQVNARSLGKRIRATISAPRGEVNCFNRFNEIELTGIGRFWLEPRGVACFAWRSSARNSASRPWASSRGPMSFRLSARAQRSAMPLSSSPTCVRELAEVENYPPGSSFSGKGASSTGFGVSFLSGCLPSFFLLRGEDKQSHANFPRPR